MLRIQIDAREHDLIALLKGTSFKHIELEISNLHIGDIVIGSTTFERKTLADLEASVKDGRYREQKQRALANCEAFSYIIEGSAFAFGDGTPQNKMLTGCIINTLVRDRIPIVRTSSLSDTANFVSCLAQRMLDNKMKYVINNSNSNSNNTSNSNSNNNNSLKQAYAASLCVQRKNNIDVAMCFTMQLSCIPGISSKKATELIKTHSHIQNMSDLVAFLKDRKPAEFAQETPGIGKTLAQAIYTFCGV